MPFSIFPAGILPGHRIMAGTRNPPSSAVPLPPANGVFPPSGHVKFSAPLSVEKAMIVLSSRPLSLTYFRTAPTMSSSCAMPASWMDQPFSGVRNFWYFGERCVTTCMRVGFSHRKNGLFVGARLVEELEGVRQDLVIDRLHPLGTERAGVLDLLLSDLAPARLHGRVVHVGGPGVEHVARADRVLGRRRVVRVAGVFHRVEVVEVAEELVEAVDGRQELVEVAQVVLAELTGGVAHGLQRRRDRSAPRPACRSSRRPGRPSSCPCGSGISPVMKFARPAVQLASA